MLYQKNVPCIIPHHTYQKTWCQLLGKRRISGVYPALCHQSPTHRGRGRLVRSVEKRSIRQFAHFGVLL